MSKDDDENLVCFSKALGESKSDKALTIEERVVQCMENEDCGCVYCNYRTSAAKMVVEFISRDMVTFEGNSGANFCSFDLKDIFFKAIIEVKDMEKEIDAEENEEE